MLEGNENFQPLLERMVAERRERFYTLWHSKAPGPVTGAFLAYDPLAPPSMTKKTIAIATGIRDGSAHSALYLAEIR